LIESAKLRGELVDLPTERILHTLMTYIGGLFTSRFVLLNRSSISDYEIEDFVRLLMDGFRKANGTDFVESEQDVKKDCFGRPIVSGGQALHVICMHIRIIGIKAAGYQRNVE
jgi:hypothetical protein